jgi:hypothetical protein
MSFAHGATCTCSTKPKSATSAGIGKIKSKKMLTFKSSCEILNPVMRDATMTEIRRYWKERRTREAKRDTFTLNGNTYEVSHDPAHQREQLEGYCGNNPK